MPRRYTMADLITRCKQRVDMENHAVISDAEWKTLISEAYGELYTMVFESGMQYFEFTTDMVTDGTSVLNEVVDHMSTVSFAYLEDAVTGRYRDLRPLQPQERSQLSGRTGGAAVGFALVDDKIYLYPTPPSGQTYRMCYVPQSPELSAFETSDTVDVVMPDGLTFLIWAVAIKAMAKTESDPGLALREREGARDRFSTSVMLRAQNAPRRMITADDPDDAERCGW